MIPDAQYAKLKNGKKRKDKKERESKTDGISNAQSFFLAEYSILQSSCMNVKLFLYIKYEYTNNKIAKSDLRTYAIILKNNMASNCNRVLICFLKIGKIRLQL